MNVAQYAKAKGVSKQSVYDKLRRGTLSYEIKDGIKHIIDSVAEVTASPVAEDRSKKLEKALKKLNKTKHKLDIALNSIEALETLLESKDSEIDTLKRTFGLMTTAIENRLVSPEEDVIEAETTPKKKKKKKK